METNEGKFNYYRLADTGEIGSLLSKLKTFNDYINFAFECDDLLTNHLIEVRDDENISDVKFIENHYYERYSNKEVSNKMAEIVLGKPAKLVYLRPDIFDLKLSKRNFFPLKTMFVQSIITNELIMAVNSNLCFFEKGASISTEVIKSLAENNQIKFLNVMNSQAHTPCKGEIESITHEHANSLKNMYSSDEYYHRIYKQACKIIRESLTNEVLKKDGREFKLDLIKEMKTGLEEYCIKHVEKKDPEFGLIAREKTLKQNKE
jgi:hypothetical protein